MSAERKVEIITDILEGQYAESFFDNRQDDVEQATLDAITHVTLGRVWVECPCYEMETRFLPENGCPECNDDQGWWLA